MNPRAPLYIPSKGRWQHARRLTSRALEQMRVPYRIVVEHAERDAYAAEIDPAKLLVLDPAYQREYDTCDDLEDSKPKGSGPARNFIWDHAASEGHPWHWVVDDNINGWARLHNKRRRRVLDGTIFRCMEDFAQRYTNISMAGPNYRFFVPADGGKPPFTPNTRIYSCNLIRTDAPFRWRGRYNEDTILSLDMLKAGWGTILFNAFLSNKMATQKIGGGNTNTVYIDGTLPKSEMLASVHPDVCRIAWRHGRWHHYCDYAPFKRNTFIRQAGLAIPDGVNEYGMQLVKYDGDDVDEDEDVAS